MTRTSIFSLLEMCLWNFSSSESNTGYKHRRIRIEDAVCYTDRNAPLGKFLKWGYINNCILYLHKDIILAADDLPQVFHLKINNDIGYMFAKTTDAVIFLFPWFHSCRYVLIFKCCISLVDRNTK